MFKQEQLEEKLEQLEKELWYLIKSTLPALKEELAGGGNPEKLAKLEEKIAINESNISNLLQEITLTKEELTSLNGEVSSNKQDIQNLKTQTQTNTSNISDNSSNIAQSNTKLESAQSKIQNIETLIAELQQKIKALEGQTSSSSGRVVEVIYDMNSTDSEINKGFTSGIIGGNSFTWTGDYDYIRIYASLQSLFAYIELPVNNRSKNDFMLHTIAATGKILHFYKGFCYADQKKITTARGHTYTLDSNAGTITFATSNNEKYFITRVEGVKGI